MGEIDFFRISASLISILVLIFLLAWLARRVGWARAGGNQPMRVISTQSLGPRAQLAMVEIGDKCLVLGITAHQINLLDTLPAGQNQSAATKPALPSFAQSLKAVLQRSS